VPKAAVRASVSAAGAEEIIWTHPSAYDAGLLRGWLAIPGGGATKPKYDALASLPIPAGWRAAPAQDPAAPHDWDVRWAPNWGSIGQTTVGRFIANNYCFRGSKALRQNMPYYEEPWGKKTVARIEEKLGELRMQGKITHDDVAGAIDSLQWLGYSLTAFLAPSMTAATISIPAPTAALKKKLVAEHAEDLAAGGLRGARAAQNVEGQLIASAREELAGVDPGVDIFNSGARGTFENNYKNVALMRGAVRRSDDPSVIRVSTASLEEGIPAKEMHIYADMVTQASYNRSISVRDGGYLAKQLNAAFQGLRLDVDPQSDCGTGLFLEITVDDPGEYMYRFVKTGPKTLTEITPDNVSTYRGKKVQMRSPLFCGGKEGVCSRCAGTFYHRLGVVNIGLLTSRIGTTIMNNNLKAFHDTTIRTVDVGANLDRYIRPAGS